LKKAISAQNILSATLTE